MTARDLAAPPSSGSAGPPKSLVAGRYKTLFLLGRGGMGTVEAALERKDGDYERIVALKRLLPDAARDRRHVEMFLREAKLAAMLEHPNVVRAFDSGEIAGELYLAMEYVEGQPLSVVLKTLREPLEPALASHVLASICDGLHAAHELVDEGGKPLSVVHRDVSPQNVMLGYDGRVRLLDFGVAKIEAESVTKTGEVKGKTAYMSPEQAMGDAIDRRSDLFGVGAVLYECLTLERMWGDGTDMEVIRKLALEEPPDLPESAPEELRALYKRLIARDAKDRPATAAEVAAKLREIAKDAAAAEERITKLLATHFADKAEELRKKLAASLDEVAPERADELRESVLPGSVPRPPAPAAPAREAEAAPSRPRWIVPAAMAVAALGVALWRATSTPPPAPPPPALTVTKVDATRPDTPKTEPSPAASSAPVVETAPPPKPSASVTMTARPVISAKPRPSASPVPSTSASVKKPPLDIDDHPF